MRRRKFIQMLIGTTADLTAGVAVAGELAIRVAGGSRQITLGEWFQQQHEERLHRLNYGRFQQRLREVLEDGHDVHHCVLLAPRGGLRFVRVYVKEGPPLTWHQPCQGECL